MRKIFGFKSITTLLYGLLMLLPMFSILSRVIYVQSNDNAKDSYYGETINDEIIVEGYNNLQTYYNYQFSLASVDSGNISYNVSNVKVIAQPIQYNFAQSLENNVKEIYVYLSNNVHYTRMQYNDNSYQYIQNLNGNFDGMVLGFYLISKPSNVLFDDFISYSTYNNDSYLDNAFDYSLKTFVDDNNYGFNFFSWFGDMFLEQNGNNMIYLNFINWYLNYGLLISVAYIFFLILLWFINLSRRILDRLMNFDGGGY